MFYIQIALIDAKPNINLMSYPFYFNMSQYVNNKMSRYYQSHHEDVVQQLLLRLRRGHKVTLERCRPFYVVRDWWISRKNQTIMSTETMWLNFEIPFLE